MAKKRRRKVRPKTKSKPNERDWTGILINSLVDLLVGTLLIIITIVIDE